MIAYSPKISEKTVRFICSFLIVLIFVSKISGKTLGVPYSFSFLIYQHGLHPYVNFFLNFAAFPFLYLAWKSSPYKKRLSKTYKLFIFALILILIIQTVFQITLVNLHLSPAIQVAGLFMAILLILMYGVFIPALFPLERFIYLVQRVSIISVLISLIFLPVFGDMFYKGGRFIGIYKHIPHMVSASTFALLFLIPSIYKNRVFSWSKSFFIYIFLTVLILVAVILTATKAALGTSLLALALSLLFFGSKKKNIRLFKSFVFSLIFVSSLFYGKTVAEKAYKVMRGENSFASRAKQDGIKSRMEEISRGLDYFHENPYFGKGLMYKFSSQKGTSVSSYNSFKDPHNLFISGGVIGGYPLMVMSIIAFFMMLLGSIAGLNHKLSEVKFLGLFLICHLPVFIIYHAHFSLGGLGDRMYYLIFGYLSVNLYIRKRNKNEIHNITTLPT